MGAATIPPVTSSVINRSVSRERRTRSECGRSVVQRAAHSSSSRMVSSIRSCDTPRSVGSAYDGNQVIEKTSSSPSVTSNSSLWVPSPAFGNRGPRSTRRSGPPTAVITGSPSIVIRRTHGRTSP